MTVVNWRTQMLSYTSTGLGDKQWSRKKSIRGCKGTETFHCCSLDRWKKNKQTVIQCVCLLVTLDKYFSPLWWWQVTMLVPNRASYWLYFSGIRNEVEKAQSLKVPYYTHLTWCLYVTTQKALKTVVLIAQRDLAFMVSLYIFSFLNWNSWTQGTTIMSHREEYKLHLWHHKELTSRTVYSSVRFLKDS